MENLATCPHCNNQQEEKYMYCLKCQWAMDEKRPSLKGDTKTKICSKCGKLTIFSKKRSIMGSLPLPEKEIYFCEDCGVYIGASKPSYMILRGSCESILSLILLVWLAKSLADGQKQSLLWNVAFIFAFVSFCDGVRRLIAGFKVRDRQLREHTS